MEFRRKPDAKLLFSFSRNFPKNPKINKIKYWLGKNNKAIKASATSGLKGAKYLKTLKRNPFTSPLMCFIDKYKSWFS